MKITRMLGVMSMIGVFALLSASDANAQLGRRPNRGSGGWGQGAGYNSIYNPKTVETLSGEVISVDRIRPEKGMAYGVHLMVKTDKESVSVHLGPEWYIERQDTEIKAKDTIQVKGSRVTYEGKPAIIAAEVKKGGDVLMLRDEKGVPYWSGWRRR